MQKNALKSEMGEGQGVFSLHRTVMSDYAEYVSSFVHIANPRIRSMVEEQLCRSNRYWPEPLIQFNPAYLPGESTEELISKGILHEVCGQAFQGRRLYRHQVAAMELGAQGKGFIVTSGTGSGKSLTFLGTIFNRLSQNPTVPGVQAIIVYPMNALINSQYEEIQGYAKAYLEKTGKDFPFTFAQYTGQENSNEKSGLKQSPPQILLTNYMMLELLLTRHQESELRQAIFANLQFLVYDELHTFRGRQGSDVAILNRRIRSSCAHNVTCIGTSATMVSAGTAEDQKEVVANVASRFFGQRFEPSQVVQEELVNSFHMVEGLPEVQSITLSLAEGIPVDSSSEEELRKHPLALWVENAIALDRVGGVLRRRKPVDLATMAQRLTDYVGGDLGENREHLQRLLFWINRINSQRQGNSKPLLPFKLHQFIAQTGFVYATLERENPYLSLEPGIQVTLQGGEVRNLYPLLFSRSSGAEFFCVALDTNQNRILPREQNDDVQGSNQAAGYILPEMSWWNPEEDFENLPDSWFKKSKQGRLPTDEAMEKLPRPIWYDVNGVYSFERRLDLALQAWFIPYPLSIDPSSGEVFGKRTRESNKLGRMGSEGRSTSTTVLSLSVLQAQAQAGINQAAQKIMSFTDNRQDAALQAGHFNDFYQVIRLRAAMYAALRKYGKLEQQKLSQVVVEELGLQQEQYAKSPSSFPAALEQNQRNLSHYVMYRLLEDLERSWRMTLPNLEQCALLRVEYKNLQENAAYEQGWRHVPLLSKMSVEQRVEFFFEVLQYLRKGFAIYSKEYLSKQALEEKYKEMREKLTDSWCYTDVNDLPQAKSLRIEPLKAGFGDEALSGGINSMFGKYVNKWAERLEGKKFTKEDYPSVIHSILQAMVDAQMLCKNSKIRKADGGDTTVYQVPVDSLLWTLGNGKELPVDTIRTKATKSLPLRVNAYFQKLYSHEYSRYTKRVLCPDEKGVEELLVREFQGAEHTGQLNNAQRKKREREFRAGALSALFCSPTMELGIDIKSVNVVHMRNVPPNAANYAQRSGRAGRSGEAALVLVNCSNFSPHDRHYFQHKQDMVAGVVSEPRVDLLNQELLRTHLHSMAMGLACVSEIQVSLFDMIAEEDAEKMALKTGIVDKLSLSAGQQKELRERFLRMCSDFLPELQEQYWFGDAWLGEVISQVCRTLDGSLDRFRKLYRNARTEVRKAQDLLHSGRCKLDSQEAKDARREEYQALKQMSSLKNEGGEGAFSEFYPYRYLASEGFLPGYNFTRLPIRAFVSDGDGGEYISRPRFVALREFGPRNVIYHNGGKHTIRKLVRTSLEKEYKQARISLDSGYFLEGDEFNAEVCPVTNASLTQEGNSEVLSDLLEMGECETRPEVRISCEEEERVSQGYDVRTYFHVPDGLSKVRKTQVRLGGEDMLRLSYIPAARLVQVNRKWRSLKTEGYLIDERTGFWKNKINSDTDKNQKNESLKTIKLYTYDWSDALFIEPVRALQLQKDGVITLMYALKRAIELSFQVEGNEIGACIMGKDDSPNIFLYESSQGSLGVLSQFSRNVEIFHQVIRNAYELCRFDEPEYKERASYNDLLSYYNQRDHERIDRFLIQDALKTLCSAQVEQISKAGSNYDSQYQQLLRDYDKNSSTEKVFLDYLYEKGLKLPDSAQKSVEGLYCQPDFYYEEMRCWIFCDGTPHDDPETRLRDQQQRDSLRARGDQVWVYYYKDDLAQMVARRPDLFPKVRL